MTDENSKSLDILGAKPITDSIYTVTKAVVDGASAFLSRICLPAAEEFGLLLRDIVSHWRAKNAVSIVQKAERKLIKSNLDSEVYAHPRLVASIIENGSWIDMEFVQDMWAGLLSSSCTKDGKDESNIIFINLLNQITSSEAKIFNTCCEKAKKYRSQGGWIFAQEFILELSELQAITAINDVHRLDGELDHLRALELIHGGFDPNTTNAPIKPTPLGLHMYVRCQGFNGSPVEFFGLSVEDTPKSNPPANENG
jgi:hypothetical protein